MNNKFSSAMKLRTFILVLAAMASMAASAQTVRGSNGLSKGKIDSDGTVRGSNGLSVGKIEGVDKKTAAAYMFFFNK